MPLKKLKLMQNIRFSKLKTWMGQQHPRIYFTDWATGLDLTVPAISRSCKMPTMPVYQHEYLSSLGVPPDLLPVPLDQRPGPKPKKTRNPSV